MKTIAKALLFMAALAMLISWTVWAGGQVGTVSEITITGKVLKHGRLQDDQGRAYLLVQDENTLQLMNHVGEKVEVKGTVEETTHGEKMIRVETFELITP